MMFADGKVIKIYCFTDNFYKELEKNQEDHILKCK